MLPVGACSGSFKSAVIRLDELTITVLQLGISHFCLQRVSVFNITDGILDLLYVRSHAFVTLAAGSHFPVHLGIFTNSRFPFFAYLGQVVSEDECGTGAVSAMDYIDSCIRQFCACVECNDSRVIPFADLAKENLSQNFSIQLQLASFDADYVNNRNHTSHYCGELHQSVFFQCLWLQWHVRRAEIHGLGDDLLDAAA